MSGDHKEQVEAPPDYLLKAIKLHRKASIQLTQALRLQKQLARQLYRARKAQLKANQQNDPIKEEESLDKDVSPKKDTRKNPVMRLYQICARNKWNRPVFTLINNDSNKFLFKVSVQNVEYQPVAAASNKKQAKREASFVCLDALGIVD